MKRFALIWSYLFHPLFATLAGTVMLLEISSHFEFLPAFRYGSLYLFFLITMVLLPLVNLLILKSFGYIGDLFLKERKERFIPFLMMLFYYFLNHYLIQRAGIFPDILADYIYGIVLATVICLILNFKIKASVHMVGISGLAGMLMGLMSSHDFPLLLLFSFLILLSGITASCRLILKAHSPFELVLGFCVGFLSLYSCIVFELGR